MAIAEYPDDTERIQELRLNDAIRLGTPYGFAIATTELGNHTASLGGYGKQYQINLDPNRLQAYGISIGTVAEAVRRGNTESGGRLIVEACPEYRPLFLDLAAKIRGLVPR